MRKAPDCLAGAQWTPMIRIQIPLRDRLAPFLTMHEGWKPSVVRLSK